MDELQMIGMRRNCRLDKIFCREIFQNIMLAAVYQHPFLISIAEFIPTRDGRTAALHIQIIDKNDLTARNDPLVRFADKSVQILQRDMGPDKAAEKCVKPSGNFS